MIPPPSFSSEGRTDYDISDLELIGKLAIDLSVSSHPFIKNCFQKCIDMAGTKGFSEASGKLFKLLLKLKQEQSSMSFSSSLEIPQSEDLDILQCASIEIDHGLVRMTDFDNGSSNTTSVQPLESLWGSKETKKRYPWKSTPAYTMHEHKRTAIPIRPMPLGSARFVSKYDGIPLHRLPHITPSILSRTDKLKQPLYRNSNANIA